MMQASRSDSGSRFLRPLLIGIDGGEDEEYDGGGDQRGLASGS